MTAITIRPEHPKDAAAIHEVTAAAFRGAPHTCGREAELVDDLRAAGALTLSLVADLGGEIVGHVAVSPVTVSESSGRWFGIGPISVSPAYQRTGIGSQLMVAALEKLRASGANGCVLVGAPAFYRRFGFVNDADMLVGDVPPEVTLSIRLAPSQDRGVVEFHPAFAAAAHG